MLYDEFISNISGECDVIYANNITGMDHSFVPVVMSVETHATFKSSEVTSDIDKMRFGEETCSEPVEVDQGKTTKNTENPQKCRDILNILDEWPLAGLAGEGAVTVRCLRESS